MAQSARGLFRATGKKSKHVAVRNLLGEIEKIDALERAFLRAHRTDARVKQRGRCKYCRGRITDATTTADHIIPRRDGGVDHGPNIAAADEICNRLKGHMSAKQFMKRLRDPEPGAPLSLWLRYMEFRINKSVIRAEKRILASVRIRH